jgi:hypothetical protein
MHQLWLLKVSEYVCMYAVCQIILVMSNKLKQINQATITSDHLFCSFLLLFFVVGSLYWWHSLSYFVLFHWRAPAVHMHIYSTGTRLSSSEKKVNLFLLLIWDVYVCCVFLFFFLYEWKSNHHHRFFYCLCFN